MIEPDKREHDLLQFAIISLTMRCGIHSSLALFFLGAALRILGGGWQGHYLPPSALLTPAVWSAPGDALLWGGVFVLGATPLVSLFVVLAFSALRRRMFDMALSAMIFLLFIVSAFLGI